jgi:serine/threonine protein kinase
MGNKYDSHSVYLIDFGLTCTYKKNCNRGRKVFNSIVGTVKYCPISSHLGLEQYPKDDLESLGYVLLYLIAGGTPWS